MIPDEPKKPPEFAMRRCVVCSTEFKVHKNSPTRTCSEKCSKTPFVEPIPQVELRVTSGRDPLPHAEVKTEIPHAQGKERKMEVGKTVEVIYPESIPAEVLIKALQTGLLGYKWTSFDGKVYTINIESISGDYHDQKIVLDKSQVDVVQDA